MKKVRSAVERQVTNTPRIKSMIGGNFKEMVERGFFELK